VFLLFEAVKKIKITGCCAELAAQHQLQRSWQKDKHYVVVGIFKYKNLHFGTYLFYESFKPVRK
jgi:hypothetical protein